jgi:hypothetical protein
MTLTLQLTPETESKLRQWAVAMGQDPEAIALEALVEKLSDEPAPLPQSTSATEFQTWQAAHPVSAAKTLDDSRESIYEGRGE